jgi:hypothetical protein
VWRIRDVYPGSELSPSLIQDPGSRILIKEFKYFNPKKAKKWVLSSKKYDPGCSSRIPDPDAEFLPSRIPDPGVKKAPNPGSGSATLIPGNISESLLTIFWGYKYLFLIWIQDSGSWIRHEKIWIRMFIPDPQNTDW